MKKKLLTFEGCQKLRKESQTFQDILKGEKENKHRTKIHKICFKEISFQKEKAKCFTINTPTTS